MPLMLIDKCRDRYRATDRTTLTVGLVSVAGYIATIFLANWAIQNYGVTSVGFGLVAPAGIWFVGLAFTFRDLTQRYLGVEAVIAAIFIGAGLSYLVAPSFAVASATAFLFSEAADLAVYTPVAKRNFLLGVFLSNVVGLCIDSLIFLQLAFHDLGFFKGQVLGKLYMTVAAVIVLYAIRPVLPRPAEIEVRTA